MLAVIRGVSRQDVAVAVLVGVLQLGGTTAAVPHQQHLSFRPLDLGGYLLLGLGAGLLVWRNRYPSPVLLGVFAATLTYALLDYPRGPIYLSLIVAFVHAILHGKRAVAYPLLLVGYPSFTLLVAQVTDRDRPQMQFLIGIAAWLLVLLVGSELTRVKQAFIRERRRRRREVELAEEAEARRRAGEERLAIARDLHDVMAHSISLINVQAGVALELMDRRPEQARQALTVIKAASKDALLEVQSVLASLRGTGEPVDVCGENGSGIALPSLSALEEITTRARLSGITVRTRVEDVPVSLPSGPDQAGARIVQEALTNVARHAGPTLAQVHLSYRRSPGVADRAELVIIVDNDATAESGSAVPAVVGTGGRGIPGMRERAEACGGTLVAGPRPGGFRVEARLPIENQPIAGRQPLAGQQTIEDKNQGAT